MTAKIIDGKAIAAQICDEVAAEVASLSEHNIQPCLAAIIVGQSPVAKAYLANKVRTCNSIGIVSRVVELSKQVDEQQLLDQIDALNDDAAVHGILLQSPLPHHLDHELVIERIKPSKDVDGFHPYNVGRLSVGLDGMLPCAPAAVAQIITRSGFKTAGKHAVLIGRSSSVGKPLMNLLLQKSANYNCTVTCCHSGTDHLAGYTRKADILVAALGVPHFVTAGMVKEGACVIDVGVNRVDDPAHSRGYRLVGDVDVESVRDVAATVSPVPGGVGPVTVAMLMRNTVSATRANTLDTE